MKMNKKGFTIVELVIVIAVIAILAGVMIPTFGGVIDNAKKTTAQQEAANIYKQMCADQDNIKQGNDFTEADFVIINDGYICYVIDGVVGDAEEYEGTDAPTGYGATEFDVPEGATVYEKTAPVVEETPNA